MQPTPPSFKDEEERIELEKMTFEVLKKRRYSKGEFTSDLCLKTGWNWDTSENFIDSVKEKYRQELTVYNSRFFLIFYALIAVLSAIVIISALDKGAKFNKINSCLEVDLTGPWQKILGSETFTQCYAIAASDLFSDVVQGGYESLMLVIGGIGLIVFLLSIIGFIVTLILARRAQKDLTHRIKLFS